MSKIERELVIQSGHNANEIALIENKELVEYHIDTFESTYTIGDIYWGRVTRIMPNLNAVFVDIGEEKEGFLHYTDLGENFPTLLDYFQTMKSTGKFRYMDKVKPLPKLDKKGKIETILKKNDWIPVQVSKEPISTKGPRLSAEISLPGRYIVFVPFYNSINVSKRITNPTEKKRLKEIFTDIKHKNAGIIVRTVAENKTSEDLHQDYLTQNTKWNALCKEVLPLDNVGKIYEEQLKHNTLLRDLLNDSFTKIHVNSQSLATSIKDNLSVIAPDKVKIVKYYKSKPNIFESFGLVPKIKSSFNKIVPLKSGGYIIMEQTEALFVIDVNSGKRNSKQNSKELDDNILKINLEAAREIAIQLRLRDIGGIIVIDFIDSKNVKVRDAIYKAMQEYMQYDKASYTILPLSRFCLMEITRERTKPQVKINTQEVCPTCHDEGKVTNVLLHTDFLLNSIQSIEEPGTLTLVVHPFIYSYLRSGFPSLILKWQWQLKRRIKLKENTSFTLLQTKIYNDKGKRIHLNMLYL